MKQSKMIHESVRKIPVIGKYNVVVCAAAPPQASGTTAALALKNKTLPNDIDISLLQKELNITK